MVANPARTNIISSSFCILWGGTIWFLILRSRRFDNNFAMVMATLLVCLGVYYLVRSLRRSN
jgi:hypothetical protein